MVGPVPPSTMVLRVFVLPALLLLSSLTGATALQWTDETAQQPTTRAACRGHDLELTWDYRVSEEETVEDTRWDVVTAGGQEVIALSVQGNFLVMPTYTGRVSYRGNASLAVHGLTFEDSGNYSVQVSAHHTGGTFDTIHHTLHVTVAEPPSSGSGGLTARQETEAVYDSSTDRYHVQLTCGQLDQPGVPPVHVVWQTPSGSEEVSTTANNGTYRLVLDSPVQGGNYSCRLSPLSPAATCLATDDPLLREATVQVDEVLARLSLLEAKNGGLTDKLDHLTRENQVLTDKVNWLTDENVQLKADLSSVNDSLKTELQQATSSLTDQLSLAQQNLQDELTDFLNRSSLHVSFHARLGSGQHFTSDTSLKFDVITTNEGDAYSAQTGTFTTPVGGTYFFIFTTSPYTGMGNRAEAVLVADHDYLAWVDNVHDGHYDLATGHAVLHLRAGAQVWVEGFSGRYYVSSYCSFTGMLVQADL